MAKVALLIGVSEYEPGLTPLPAAAKDVDAMQQVLLHPEIGGFDEVKVLLNPQQHEMAVAIEILFDERQKDDLVLLFFSGHGIKDEDGKLYLAAHNTRKIGKGVPARATTVPASFVHDVMNKSCSKREVVILDCCFSGAFAEGMAAKDDGFVDVKNQLGGEGRAVLTSSTSTQFAFEQQGVETSTYTSYIVEGLETGAADRDEDGWISVDELHEYAAKKVQESTPAMKPEIYPVKGGFKIKLAKAPSNDPRLTYLREVEYWVEGGNGEISVAGRTALDALQETLQLSSEDAAAIETQVLAPIENKRIKLQRYELAFRDEIRQGFPLSDRTGANLKRLQQALGLRDEDIALIEAPIIAEQPLTPPLGIVNPPPPELSKFNYIVGSIIGVIGVIFGGTVVYFSRVKDEPQPVVQSIVNSCVKEEYALGDRISLGEEILLKQDTNSDKEAGVKAFLNGDCLTAINKFNSYRQANFTNKTDPEALIYLNNAKARQQTKHIKIAVSVPIGTTPNVAKEMLRGVAQAQDEVNSSTGINGKALEVAIANDDNDPSTAVQLATQFVADTNILAVVGHNASNASIAAAPVYQKGGLVMMSPTSFAQNLTSIGNYIFRTAPSVSSIANSISRYAINTEGKNNFLICIDDQAIDNLSFKQEFIQAIKATEAQTNPTKCDVSAPNFNPDAVISQAKSKGANAMLLALYIDRIKEGLTVARANQGQLAVFSSPTLYTNETLKAGKALDGLVIAVPWHSAAFPNNSFAQNAQKFWNGTVNWRTATAYDATLAIVAGFKTSNTRYELQKTLHDSSFSVDGATGKIQFAQSGDRKDNAIFLVKVQQIPGTDKYEFVPIQP
ncbi:ABC transporter substrate-binding protein [Nostoc sp. TCL240-02]|uniref:caspase, EACC1-associated type n=1 Tax=Nostoc sp. TCL240-02 TaxID=2572090 RepID=UPI00157F99FF|nr:ABC transporter substrate-binding protein [Nostoc sp. TCL240-02]QKQ75999.1 ABC transporter substrate-binding protein [Nostoc sp. TCL240-02]